MSGRWVFLNGDRGVAAVRAIAAAGFDVDRIIVPSKGLEQLGRELAGIAELTPVDNVNDPDFVRAVKAAQADTAIVAGFATILKRHLISAFPGGILNLHAGRVPQYRGGSPLNWQLISGEPHVGLSILRLDESIDGGAVVQSELIEVDPEDDIGTLHNKANQVFGQLLVRALKEGTPGVPQDETLATYWLQRSDADSEIDWPTMSAAQVHNFVRALTRPYPGAKSGSVRIWKTQLPTLVVRGAPGRVGFVAGLGPLVCCKDHAVLLVEYSGARLRTGQYLPARD